MTEREKLAEFAARGVTRVRLGHWADPEDYMRLDIVNGQLGPWGHVYSPLQPIIGEPTPQDVLLIGRDSSDWLEYTGKLNPLDSED